jgi:hypothetical protein
LDVRIRKGNAKIAIQNNECSNITTPFLLYHAIFVWALFVFTPERDKKLFSKPVTLNSAIKKNF